MDPENRRFHQPDQTTPAMGPYKVYGRVLSIAGENEAPILLARHRDTGISVLAVSMQDTPGSRGGLIEPESLLGRAQAVMELGHDGFPLLFDQGSGEGGLAWLTWRTETRVSLREQLESGRVDARRAVAIARSVAEALGALHRSDKLHGSLSPGSILLASPGGIALPTANLLRPDRLLKEGAVPSGWGAAAYRAPEQLGRARDTGDVATRIGPASDIFSLGTILYEATVGRTPFMGRTFEDMARSIQSEPFAAPQKDDPQLPRVLCDIFAKSLAKDPADRYASIADMQSDLVLLAETLAPRPARARGGISRASSASASIGAGATTRVPDRLSFERDSLLGRVSERRQKLADEGPPPTWLRWTVPLGVFLMVAITVWFLFLRP